MLKISKEQMEAFQQAALKDYEDQMVEHLKKFTPKHSEVIGEPGLRRVIQLGMDRAKNYGLTNRGPVRFYIEMMFMLGSDFDTDPQLPWAGEILDDTTISDQTVRADLLYDKAMDYIDTVAGPDYGYAREALRRASQERLEGFSMSDGNFENRMIMRMNMIYPQKCEYLGESTLQALISRGIELARKHPVSTDAGVILFIGLMFALGHGFATDPQFPWIEGTLNNTAISDPNKRVERLYSKMMTYLNRALAYLERG